jgi:hypothetical protein
MVEQVSKDESAIRFLMSLRGMSAAACAIFDKRSCEDHEIKIKHKDCQQQFESLTTVGWRGNGTRDEIE